MKNCSRNYEIKIIISFKIVIIAWFLQCLFDFCSFREKSKTLALETQNGKLQKLIGPYRHQLEMYEAENKKINPKSDVDLVEKYTKLLDQQNQKQKMRQIIKLRNDVSQLKKVSYRFESFNDYII